MNHFSSQVPDFPRYLSEALMVYVLCMSGATTGLQKLFAGTTLQERKEAPDGSRNHQRFWLGCVHPLGDFDFIWGFPTLVGHDWVLEPMVTWGTALFWARKGPLNWFLRFLGRCFFHINEIIPILIQLSSGWVKMGSMNFNESCLRERFPISGDIGSNVLMSGHPTTARAHRPNETRWWVIKRFVAMRKFVRQLTGTMKPHPNDPAVPFQLGFHK